MKKLYQKLLSLTAAAAILCSAAVSVSASDLIYSNAFSTADEVNELVLVGDGLLDGKPPMTFDEERGAMYFEGWGQNTGFLLPVNVTAANFVAEADIIYEKKPDYRDRGIGYGFIFGYQDSGNFSDVVYYPLNGNVIMHNAVNGSMNSRYAEKGNGASVTVSDTETAHLKLIVNSGQMEFFVNNELCYSYYSDTAQGNFNDFTRTGRLGFFFNADKTMLTVKNLVVRTVDSADTAYYTNAYMGQQDDSLQPLSGLSSYFKEGSVSGGNWGYLGYGGAGWDSVGRYIDLPLSGNYSVDMNFAFENPLNASRYLGFAIGLNEEADGGLTYTFAGVKENGQMSIEQKTVTAGDSASESTISGAQAAYASCQDTIPEDKKNPDVDMSVAEADRYLVSYMPDGYNSEDSADVNSRRHDLHLEVVDGVISMTFEGTTVTLDPDVNDTDGYLAIRSAGTNARIYSLRVAPYNGTVEPPEPTPPSEPETTVEVDYTEIASDYADVDITVNDEEELIGEKTRALLAVYKDGVLAGVGIEEIPESGEVSFSIDLEAGEAETETARIMLWDLDTMRPVIGVTNVE